MDVLRTPEARFDGLKDYAFVAHYHVVKAEDGTELRVHYLDEGPRDAPALLCMHGEPSWSYLYRKMIPLLTAAGYRVIAPDLVGFGKSDKPAAMADYTYSAHVDWMNQWLRGLDLNGLTLVCQDWGGLIGLRLFGDNPDRFDRLVIANTGLPGTSMLTDDVSAMMAQMFAMVPVPDAAMVGEQFRNGGPGAFLYWVKYASESPSFSVRDVFGLLSDISDEAVLDGYCAPFPDDSFIAGARKFPALVPLLPQHKDERLKNDAVWKVLETCGKPVLTAFSDGDPVTKGGEALFIARIPGIKNVTVEGGGHFLQEDAPDAFAREIIAFMQES